MKMFVRLALVTFAAVPALAQADGLVIAGGGGSSYVGSGSSITSVTLESMYVNYGTGEFSGLGFFSPITVSPSTINLSSPVDPGLFTFGTFSFNSTSLTATEINQGSGQYEFELQGSGTLTNSAADTTEAASFTLAGETTTPGSFEGYSATLDTSPVPAPASVQLLLAGLFGFGVFARVRNKT